MDVRSLGTPGRTISIVGPGEGDAAAQASLPALAGLEAAVPHVPPVEALQEVEAALLRAEWMHSQGRELHFRRGLEGRVHVELRDLEGRVLRTLAGSEALELATGGPTPQSGGLRDY